MLFGVHSHQYHRLVLLQYDDWLGFRTLIPDQTSRPDIPRRPGYDPQTT